MIYEIILPRLDVGRSGKVYSVGLANGLDVVVGACQALYVRMELLEVALKDRGRVACRVAGDEYGSHNVAGLRLDLIDHDRHLVEFFGANVRAVSEAEIDL